MTLFLTMLETFFLFHLRLYLYRRIGAQMLLFGWRLEIYISYYPWSWNWKPIWTGDYVDTWSWLCLNLYWGTAPFWVRYPYDWLKNALIRYTESDKDIPF